MSIPAMVSSQPFSKEKARADTGSGLSTVQTGCGHTLARAMAGQELGFLGQVANAELRFADHQHASGYETDHGGRARKDGNPCSYLEEKGLTVVGSDRSSHGNKSRCRKQPEAGVEQSQRPEQQLGSYLQRS